ncbi:MAG: RsmE family RNA methyltransferase [Spirochaetota bacterium]
MRRYLLPESFAPDHQSSNHAAAQPPHSRIRLAGDEFHYLVHVLRCSRGSRFEAIDRQGRPYMAEISQIHADSLELELQPIPGSESSSESQLPAQAPTGSPEYYLYQALLKGKNMEAVLRQAAAAGVHHIIPLQSEHAVAKIENPQREEKKHSRWDALIKEAIQQSGSSVITRIHPSTTLQTVEKNWSSSTLGLFFHEVPLENGSLHRYLSSCPHKVALFIGPEGGFSKNEVRLLRSIGCRPVHLHTNILRAETAAIYAIGAVQTIVGEKNQWKPVLQSPETTDTAEFR